jgi:hypothetical protein
MLLLLLDKVQQTIVAIWQQNILKFRSQERKDSNIFPAITFTGQRTADYSSHLAAEHSKIQLSEKKRLQYIFPQG